MSRILSRIIEKEAEKIKTNDKVRRVGFKELINGVVNAQPNIPPVRKERVRPGNAYYAVLDRGREFLVWKKRHASDLERLPESLSSMVVELEKLMKKMNMTAITDDYDYSVHYNECYFDLMQVNSLSMKLDHSLNNYLKSEGKSAARDKKGQVTDGAYTSRISKLAGLAGLMITSSKAFMDQLEREFSIDSPSKKKPMVLTKPGQGWAD